ncbi:hypothetical protein ACFP1Z_21420 [Streptomyces gamaensis]|uniref:Secreted protein n=1 Tax=Streptomyces gamaensis TaxID=1763542 RepID=A0ABW0Z6M9_9ACTN
MGGSLAGVVALGVLAFSLFSGAQEPARAAAPAPAASGSGSSRQETAPPSPRYRLTVPSSLLDGQYTLAQDISRTMDGGIAGSRSGSNERNMKGAGGQYTSVSGQGPQTLLVSGLYGEIKDPRRSLDSMFKGMTEHPGVEITTPVKDITPPGVQEPVTCEVFSFTRSGRTGSIAACGWSDHSTVVTVSASDTGTSNRVSLDELAANTAKVRDQVRVPRV